MSHIYSFFDRYIKAGKIQKPISLRFAVHMPGVCIFTACGYISCILWEAIFQFLLCREISAIYYAVFKRNFYIVLLFKVLRSQTLQENQSTCPVGERMEEFNGNTVAKNNNPECTLTHLVLAHICKRIAVFLSNFGSGLHLLQIIPKSTFAKSCRNGRKAFNGDVQSRL